MEVAASTLIWTRPREGIDHQRAIGAAIWLYVGNGPKEVQFRGGDIRLERLVACTVIGRDHVGHSAFRRHSLDRCRPGLAPPQ